MFDILSGTLRKNCKFSYLDGNRGLFLYKNSSISYNVGDVSAINIVYKSTSDDFLDVTKGAYRVMHALPKSDLYSTYKVNFDCNVSDVNIIFKKYNTSNEYIFIKSMEVVTK